MPGKLFTTFDNKLRFLRVHKSLPWFPDIKPDLGQRNRQNASRWNTIKVIKHQQNCCHRLEAIFRGCTGRRCYPFLFLLITFIMRTVNRKHKFHITDKIRLSFAVKSSSYNKACREIWPGMKLRVTLLAHKKSHTISYCFLFL